MANKKINDLALGASLLATMQLETDIAGTTANKITMQQIFDEIDSRVAGSSFDYFFSNTAEGVIAGYDLMYPHDTGESESTVSASITGAATLIQSFITEPAEPPFTVLVEGIYDIHIHAAKTAGTQDAEIYFEFYKYDTGDVETLLATSEISSVLAGSKTSYDLHFSLAPDENLDITDRLVIKSYGNPVGVGTAPTVTLYLEGTNASRFEVKTTSDVFARAYDGVQEFFAAKHGNDSNSGLSEHKPFLTAVKLLNESNAVASVSNHVKATILDAGTYSVDSVGVSSYVSLCAEAATLTGNFFGIADDSRAICKRRDGGFTETSTGGGIGIFECDYMTAFASGVAALRMQNNTSVNAKIRILEIKIDGADGVLINSATSLQNILYIDTILLSEDNVVGINVNAGYGTIVIGQVLKTGAFTNTTDVKVSVTATADIIILGKNEADNKIVATDHNHNLISTDRGILLGGSNPLLSLKGYASTQRPIIHTSFAEGTPASPATIFPTADLGKWTGYGERQDYATPGEQEYTHIKFTTQVADNEDGRIIMEVNDVTTTTVTTHKVLDYAAKTGGALGEFSVPLAVAGFSMPTADGSADQPLVTDSNKVLSFGDRVFMVDRSMSQFVGPLSLGTPSPIIPFPATPPLITEGTQTHSIIYSVKNASNWIEIDVNIAAFSNTVGTVFTIAIFAGTTYIGGDVATLLAVNGVYNARAFFEYQPGTTSPITYTVRCGPQATPMNITVGTATTNHYQTFSIEETRT